MFYFRTTPFYTTDDKELRQFARVAKFRKTLEKAGVLFWQYDQPIEFERYVREHLIRQILEISASSSARRRGGATAKKRKAAASETSVVFMSAAREDMHRVVPIYRALADAGLRPWLDVQNLVPGERWELAIDTALKTADVFVPFMSPKWNSREYFKKEIAAALGIVSKGSRRLSIIPVRLEPISLPPSLAAYQWVDLSSDADAEKLVAAIHSIRRGKKPTGRRSSRSRTRRTIGAA